MLRLAIASILTLPTACHDCPPDDEPDDSSSSSAGESDSSTGEPDCVTPFHACWDSDDADRPACLAAYFACDHDAEVYYEVCTEQVHDCVWTCCPYEVGSNGWSTMCFTEEIEACKDACGLFADCLP